MKQDQPRESKPAVRKPYLAPRLIPYGSVAKLTAIKSGAAADAAGGRGQDLPPIRRR